MFFPVKRRTSASNLKSITHICLSVLEVRLRWDNGWALSCSVKHALCVRIWPIRQEKKQDIYERQQHDTAVSRGVPWAYLTPGSYTLHKAPSCGVLCVQTTRPVLPVRSARLALHRMLRRFFRFTTVELTAVHMYLQNVHTHGLIGRGVATSTSYIIGDDNDS